MPRRSLTRRRIVRAPRRRTVWARVNGTINLQTGEPFNAQAVDLLASFQARYGADPVGCTLLRLRGVVGLRADSTAGYTAVVAARVGADHDAALTSSEQNPMTNGEYLDWFMYEPFIAGQTEFDGDSPMDVWAGTEATARVIDVKAKRKLEEMDETIIMNIGSGTPLETTLFGHYSLSLLLALP